MNNKINHKAINFTVPKIFKSIMDQEWHKMFIKNQINNKMHKFEYNMMNHDFRRCNNQSLPNTHTNIFQFSEAKYSLVNFNDFFFFINYYTKIMTHIFIEVNTLFTNHRSTLIQILSFTFFFMINFSLYDKSNLHT